MADEPSPILADPDRMAGVWANDFEIVLGPHEITLDFFRLREELDLGASVC